MHHRLRSSLLHGVAGAVLVLALASCGGEAPTESGESGPEGPPPSIGLSSPGAEFSAEEGGSSPEAQTIQVTNEGGGSLADLTADVEYGSGGPTDWLTATLGGTIAPTTLELEPSLDPALPVDVHGAEVVVSAPGAENSPREVAVSFTVTRDWDAYVGDYVLDPTIEIACPTPVGMDAYGEFSLGAGRILEAAQDELLLELDVVWAPGAVDRTFPLEIGIPVDPVEETFAASTPIAFELSGTITITGLPVDYTVTGEGSLSLDATVVGSRFEGQVDLSLEVTGEVPLLGDFGGTCTEVSTDVTVRPTTPDSARTSDAAFASERTSQP